MNKQQKINVIVKDGILDLLIDYFDWYGRSNENAEYVFNTIFKDDTFVVSEHGQKVLKHWANMISENCTEVETNEAYENVVNEEDEFNKNFYQIFPNMFAGLLLNIKALKQENKLITDELDVAQIVVNFLGRKTLGAKPFIYLTKQAVEEKNKETELNM